MAIGNKVNLFAALLAKQVGSHRLTVNAQMVKLKDEVAELEELVQDGTDPLSELADVVIVCAMMTHCAGHGFYELIDEINRKMDVNLERQWFPTASGTARHTPEPTIASSAEVR